MDLASALNQDWLKEIELLDNEYEFSENLEKETLEPFFHDFGNEVNCDNIKQGILTDITTELNNTVEWFLRGMPPLYLWSTSRRAMMHDILAIISSNVIRDQQTAERYDAETETTTVIAPQGEFTATTHVARALFKYQCKFLRIFNSFDKRIAVCELYHSPYSGINELDDSEKLKKKLGLLKKAFQKYDSLRTKIFIESLDKNYFEYATIAQILIDFKITEYCRENENAYVDFLNVQNVSTNDYRVRIDVGFKYIPTCSVVENIVGIFARYDFQLHRVIASEFDCQDGQKFTILHLVAATPDGAEVTKNERSWGKVLKSIRALTYVDHNDHFTSLVQGKTPYSLNEINLVRAIANWTHIFLTKINPYSYSLDRVSKTLLRNTNFIDLYIRYFRGKFDPRFKNDRQAEVTLVEAEVLAIARETWDQVEKNILMEGLKFLKNVLKTNYFILSKSGLTFRVDPAVLNREVYSEIPYGIFYMIGRNYRCFQVRYRDISRGGMRLVMPKTEGDYEGALANIFDEVNGLAYSQQMKNKDIPEGGSKCVLVLQPGGDKSEAVKSAVSGLLDLIIPDENTGVLPKNIIDYYGRDEIIYLGPDENLTNDLIEWIIHHALHRRYRYSYALMSSKPGFGINHKAYGVTSEGVNVYVDNVINYLGLQNSDFRVKMTGGPDGDVAGNEMNILHREYGERCRLVAVSDGLGAAYDPRGLNWTEILRLFKEGKSIVEFDKSKLADAKAFVIAADSKENIRIRDHLFFTTEAEIFIPCGGRPYTVRENNWEKYLNARGEPTSQAIVEGANIFFTKEARQKLVDSGIVVIKDSSANKAGVTASSYEIIACLTLGPEEFAVIKPDYVKQVLDMIRRNADQEARLLFREWLRNRQELDLVKLSYEVSNEINKAKDILLEKLSYLSDEELAAENLTYILLSHCPQILVEKYRSRIIEKLPRAHKIAILGAHMASHLVYREGLYWLDSMSADQIYQTALDYMESERQVEKMLVEIENSVLSNREEIVDIVRSSGAKFLASQKRG